MMDEQIIKRFKTFQKETRKHIGFDIEKVKFQIETLSNEEKFSFVNGKAIYGKEFIKNYPGDIPLLSSSLVNNGIVSHVSPESDTHIVKEKCVTFNKDNAAGSRAFYRDFPFVMDRHNYAIIPSNQISCKYLALTLDYLLVINKYGWGDNVANSSEIKKLAISFPKNLSETYDSYKIQEILVEFIEYYVKRNGSNLQVVNNVSNVLVQIEKLVFPLFFQKHVSVSKKFDGYCKKNKINLKLSDIEFEDRLIDDVANLNGGGSDYSKAYFNNPDNKGIYDVLTGSLSPVSNIKPNKESDIITQESISFNKDNDAGSRAFYHNKPYIVGGHHYAVLVKPEFKESIHVKYFYYTMKHLFDNNMFYQSKEPRANSGVIKMFSVKFPKSTEEFSSLEIQKIIVDFTENYLSKITTMKSATEKLKTTIAAHTQTIIYKTFNS
jgi:uncharacterized protein (UPF0332 family)